MKKTLLSLFICAFIISCSSDSESDMQDDTIEMNDTSDDSNDDDDSNTDDSNDSDDGNDDDNSDNNDDNNTDDSNDSDDGNDDDNSDNNDDNNTDDSNDSDDGNDDDTTQKLTYTKDISPIISNNCLNCHGAIPRNGAPSRASFNTYELVNNNASSMDARMNNTSNPMPSSGLISQDLRDQFKQWITDGKLE